MEQPGLLLETVQEARVLISRKFGGIGASYRFRLERSGDAIRLPLAGFRDTPKR
jgi:hypothetical protein